MTTPVLPDGGILLHVGPHKTGTTAIQGALAAARPRLKDQGILYPGKRAEHNRQAAAAIQRSLGWDRRKLDMTYWDDLVKKVHRYPGRVVVSSEVFCEASPEAADKIVTDLDPGRVTVVVTLRPLERLLPSNWQQYIKSGYKVGYEQWLEGVLKSRDVPPTTPSFWMRNNHPAVIRRWGNVIGLDRVVVVVVDASQPRGIFDTFEDMLRLPRNTLNADETGPSNRSLSAPEAELLRQFNRRVRTRISHADYYRFVKRGAVRSLVEGRVPGADEPRLVTPGWAVERAREFSKSDVAEIAEMGVTVVGDLDCLAPTSPIRDEPVQRFDQVPTGLAAAFMVSLLETGIDLTTRPPEPPVETAPEPGFVMRARRKLRSLMSGG